jgi:hypothetical protein
MTLSDILSYLTYLTLSYFITRIRLRLHWRLPLLSSPVTSVSFHPKNNFLIVTQADNSFLLYEADEMNLSEWSKCNSTDIIKKRFSDVKTVISGVTFDSFAENSVILYSFGCLVFIDLTQGIPASCNVVGHRNRSYIGGDDVEGDGDERARKMLKTLNGKGNSGVRGGITGKGRGKSGRLSADDIEDIDDSHTNGHGDGSGAMEIEDTYTNGSASASVGKRSSSVAGIVVSNGTAEKQGTPSKHSSARSSNGTGTGAHTKHDSTYGPSLDNDTTVLAVGENSTSKVRKNTCTFSVVMRYKSLIHIGFAPGKHLVSTLLYNTSHDFYTCCVYTAIEVTLPLSNCRYSYTASQNFFSVLHLYQNAHPESK